MGSNEGEKSMNVFIDIETIPEQPESDSKAFISETIQPPATMSKPETIAQWHNGEGKYAGVKEAAIEKSYRDTSFDAARGEIISVSFAINDGEIQTEYREIADSEAALLSKVFADIYTGMNIHNSSYSAPPYFIGHYVAGFDLKFLFQRAVILGVKPPFPLPFSGRHEKDFYCTQQAWAGYGGRMKQDNLCKALGIEGKPDDIDASKVWDFVKSGNVARVAEYNADDVEKVRLIYNRLNFI